tara:strand:+ start:120 stop:566 length:447 start_codon:yes stop_codon:yes gene_type:complete
MAELPFELHKKHKAKMRDKWKSRGMKIDHDDFDYVYNEYIHATNCELCNKLFTKSIDRQLDHDHNTGEVRNIVCNKCNSVRKDNKKKQTNTGYDYISKIKDKKYKTGYCFRFRISRDGKNVISTSRKTLEEAIICRDEFIANHPEIFT